MTKPKHSGGPTWKKDHPSTLLSYSVVKADNAVKQAMSHPQEIALEHAFNSMEHAENALSNAEQRGEHLDMVGQNKEHIELMKDQLKEVQEIVEDR